MHKMAITYWLEDPNDHSNQASETCLAPIKAFDKRFNEHHTAMLVIPAGRTLSEVKERFPGYTISEISRSVAYPTLDLPNANVAINHAIDILHSIELEYTAPEVVKLIYAAVHALCAGLETQEDN